MISHKTYVFAVLLLLGLLLFSGNACAFQLEVGIGGEREISTITGYIQRIYVFASGIVGAIAAIMIVIGGFQYATAAGNQKAISSAKETIASSLVGLVIVAMTFLILQVFGTQFVSLDETDLQVPELPAGWHLDCRPDSDSSTGGSCQSVKGEAQDDCLREGYECSL